MECSIRKLQIIEEINHDLLISILHLLLEFLLPAEPSVGPDLVEGELPEILSAVPVGGDQEVGNGFSPEIFRGQLGAEETDEARQVIHVRSQD